MRALCLTGLLVLVAGQGLMAQEKAPDNSAQEKLAFEGAVRAFEDGVHDRARREFSEFAKKYPDSSRLNEAILFEARSAMKLNQADQAAALLESQMSRAGSLSDQFRYWEAEAFMQSSNYLKAAEMFALLGKDYTNSVRLLEAGYGEALARYKLGDLARVGTLLQDPAGNFLKGAQARGNDEGVVLGNLLLGDTLLELKKFDEARAVLEALGGRELTPEYHWRRQHLMCRVLLASRQGDLAMAQVTNLIALAASTGLPELSAESVELQGAILEAVGKFDEAIGAYEINLADSVPVERRRYALLKSIQLRLRLDRVADAVQKLEQFFERYPADAATDVGLLTYGELRLKQLVDALGPIRVESPAPVPESATNLLVQAMSHFDGLLTNHPASDLTGKAWLNKGWCQWIDGKVPDALAAFQNAATQLPFSLNQAVARFKLGDAYFYLKDHTNALLHYKALVLEYVEVSEVRYSLFDRALFQVIQAALNVGDLGGAGQALDQLLKETPDSPYADRAMFIVAQSLNHAARPAEARTLLTDCAKRYGARQLLPEVELAIARTFVQEQNWSVAITRYETWLDRFTNSLMRSRAEFNLAWANDRAGRDTNAFRLYTNFVVRFAGDPLIPKARMWIADYYVSQKDYVNAQFNYQDTNLLASPLAYLARMMAGRSAFWGERWKTAADHFRSLITDSLCPPEIAVEARFALGDTYIRQEGDPAKPQEKFKEAIVAFSKIPQLFPDDPRVANAWGRIGDCYYTMGALDPTQYDSATNAFHKAIATPTASLALRSQATVKLGMVKEQLARNRNGPEKAELLDASLNHYLNVVYGQIPGAEDVEEFDPFWVKEAGLAAGRVAEETGQWDVALNLYQRLGSLFPPMETMLAKRGDRVKELRSAPRSPPK